MADIPAQFANVTVPTRANVYFDGGVVSHTLLFADGSKKTLGLIRPGKYHFGTAAAERMEIVAGTCWVRVDGQTAVAGHGVDQVFEVPANSGFDIEVREGLCQYICSFLA
jgi:uncharacterized protein YaiE (UPF0345 family)